MVDLLRRLQGSLASSIPSEGLPLDERFECISGSNAGIAENTCVQQKEKQQAGQVLERRTEMQSWRLGERLYPKIPHQDQELVGYISRIQAYPINHILQYYRC